MMTLVELMEANRIDSFEKFGKRAGMSGANAHRFATGRNSEFPAVDTITGLAEALGVSPALVVMATAQGLGIDMSEAIDGSMLGRTLPPEADDLPAYAKQHVRNTVQTLIAAVRGLPAPVDAETDDVDIDEVAKAARRRLDRAASTLGEPRQIRKR